MNQILDRLLIPAAFLLVAGVVIYFLVAPPLMIADAKASGQFPSSPLYTPVLRALESNLTSPMMLWYCNEVWDGQIVLLGDDSLPIDHIILYLLAALAYVAAMGWWIRRRMNLKIRPAHSANFNQH